MTPGERSIFVQSLLVERGEAMGSLPTRRFLHYAIITHPAVPQILLVQGPAGWSLPRFESAEHYLGEVGYINRAIREQFGIEVTVLRCVRNECDAETATVRRIHEAENHTPHWTIPQHGKWVRQKELDALTLAQPNHRAVLESWFHEQETRREPRDGRDWTLSGWWEQAAAWIAQQLRQHGYGEILAIEQIKAWEFSCVLYVRTHAGTFYFKAAPRSLARELTVTQRLAALHPRQIPAVVAVETAHRWLLTRAARGSPLMEVSDLSRWECAADAYARLQIDWIERTGELLALGCPDRTLTKLAQEIDPLLADTAALLPGQPQGLSAAEITQLRARAPEFKAMCHELAQYAIPPSLEHGDLWGVNVIAGEDGITFIDWDEPCLAHPFFSLLELTLSVDFQAGLSQVADARARVRDAYLDPWTRYEPRDRLVRACELSQQLAALHLAANYRRWLPMIETVWDLRELIPFFLKLLVNKEGGQWHGSAD